MALLDQTPKPSFIQSKEVKSRFLSDKNFVEKIESRLPQNAKIFTLPFMSFPEAAGGYANLIGYLHSKNLRWSYPSMRGRKSDAWQEKVSKLDFRNFIFELKKVGFSGVFINRPFYENLTGEKLEKIEAKLKSVSTKPELISQDQKLVFFEF